MNVSQFRRVYQCGNCQHNHACGRPCGECDCATFALSDADRDHAFEQEHREVIAFNGEKTVLAAPIVETIGGGCIAWVDGARDTGEWDVPPAFMLITVQPEELTNAAPEAELQLLSVGLKPLPLPDDFWSDGDADPIAAVVTLAHIIRMSTRWFELFWETLNVGPEAMPVGWAMMLEGNDVDIDGDGRVVGNGDVRYVLARDIDGRAYGAWHTRADGKRGAWIETPNQSRANYAAIIAEIAEKRAASGDSDAPRPNLAEIELLDALLSLTYATAEALLDREGGGR